MQLSLAQRWRARRPRWARRPVIDPRRHEVAAIGGDAEAKAFVLRHHYLGSYPAARFRFGLYRDGALAGVAVFSHPCNDRVITNVFPGEVLAGVELGRFVLLDQVEQNGETWFLARCFRALAREGLEGVVAFSDPVPRTTAAGERILPGHVGTIYQAHNAAYLGRTRAAALWVLADGTTLHGRALAKVRAQARGWRAVAARLEAAGAPAPGADPARWLATWLPRVARRLRHPGKHRYAWALSRGYQRHVRSALAYPKQVVARPQAPETA